jgi:hypothetical protein
LAIKISGSCIGFGDNFTAALIAQRHPPKFHRNTPPYVPPYVPALSQVLQHGIQMKFSSSAVPFPAKSQNAGTAECSTGLTADTDPESKTGHGPDQVFIRLVLIFQCQEHHYLAAVESFGFQFHHAKLYSIHGRTPSFSFFEQQAGSSRAGIAVKRMNRRIPNRK